MNRLLSFAAAGLLALGVTASLASPAAAEPLLRSIPDGGSLFAVDCYDEGTVQLWNLGTTPTGVAAPVGAPIDIDNANCAGQAAYNAIDGFAYYVSWSRSYTLVKVDPATGTATQVGVFRDADGNGIDVYAIAILPDGTAYSTVYGDSGYELWTLDLATGVGAPIGSLDVDADPYSLASDPTTGTLYLITDDGSLFSVDTGTGSLASLAQFDLSASGGTAVYGMAIDRSGVIWLVNWPDSQQTLYTAALSDPENTVQLAGAMTRSTDGDDLEAESLFIVPGTPAPAPPAPAVTPAAVVKKPELAATGANAQQTVLFASVGGGVLLLGAGLLVVGRMRRKRSNG